MMVYLMVFIDLVKQNIINYINLLYCCNSLGANQ